MCVCVSVCLCVCSLLLNGGTETDLAYRFWEMLGYLANTLIFILVGVVISQQAFSDVESLGWMYLIVLYFTLIVIR